MKLSTVKQLARDSGVSVRTLHHYDEIGLLKPATVGDNGYRYYGRDEFLRLQQILFHKELGFALAEITTILDAPGFDQLAALERQRRQILSELKRHSRLLKTIDATIEDIKGDKTMKTKKLYEGFTPEKQREHEIWLIKNGGAGMAERIADSKRPWNLLNADQKAERMAMLAEIEQSLANAMREGTSALAVELDPILEQHRKWIVLMWGRPCPPDAYAELASLYRSHPDFIERYEATAEGFCEWLGAAMVAYSARHSE